MKKILTAEEFLKSKGLGGYQEFDGVLQEFAKLHVEAALKEASEKFDHYSNKNTILGSYSLDNIE